MQTHVTVADIAVELGITMQEVIQRLASVGIHGASASTQLGKADIRELTDQVKPWSRIVAHVTKPDSNSPLFEIEKRDGAIVLSREWDPQSNRVVWTKIYQPTTTSGSANDLSFLCEWESELLTRAARIDVEGCAQLLESSFKPSPLHMGDTPMDKRQRRKSRLRTYDAGATLDVWRLMKPRAEGYAQPHPFVAQRSYLQLVRGILIALQDFHGKGFIHCDLHPGNIALPVLNTKPQFSPDRGEYIQVEPIWDDIRIIDLDFSASQAIAPPIRLPHQLTEFGLAVSPMSDHLRLRLLAIDHWLASTGQMDRCYDREFWARPQNNDHLRCFQTLDWREDLYQLGFWLAYIRDSWGGAAHVVTMGDGGEEVNRFIETFPEQLMEWGSCEQIVWNPESRINSVKAPTELPHAGYIAQVDRLIRKLGDLPKKMVLLRQDHDPQYDPTQCTLGSDNLCFDRPDPFAKTDNNAPKISGRAIPKETPMREPVRAMKGPKLDWRSLIKPASMGLGLLIVVAVWQVNRKNLPLLVDDLQIRQIFKQKGNEGDGRGDLTQETFAWQEATSKGTRASVNEFMSRYPNSQFVSLAAARIRELDVQDLQERERQRVATEKSGKDKETELTRADEAAWSLANSANSISSYQAYLGTNFGQRYAKVAAGRIQTLYDEENSKLERESLDRQRNVRLSETNSKYPMTSSRNNRQGTTEDFAN